MRSFRTTHHRAGVCVVILLVGILVIGCSTQTQPGTDTSDLSGTNPTNQSIDASGTIHLTQPIPTPHRVTLPSAATLTNLLVPVDVSAPRFVSTVDYMSALLGLRQNMPVHIRNCGFEDAYFDESTQTIIICTELLAFIDELLIPDFPDSSDRQDANDYMFSFILAQTMAETVIKTQHIPITDGIEESVNQLALLLVNEAGLSDAALIAATIYHTSTTSPNPVNIEYWQTYLPEQSFSDLLCWLYGSDPIRYEYLTTIELQPGVLFVDPARQCQAEYANSVYAWNALLAYTSGAPLAPTRNTVEQTYAGRVYFENTPILSISPRIVDTVERVNELLYLPYDIEITFAECGEANAFYLPETRQIQFCTEFISFIGQQAQTLGSTPNEQQAYIDNTIITILYHEFAHALVHAYSLPITGSEEDVVDQIATVLLVSLNKSDVPQYAGVFFAELAVRSFDERPAYEDTHSLSGQRFYNFLCWTYGSDPATYANYYIPNNEWDSILPATRAPYCAQEYEFLASSIGTLLEPYVKGR